MHCGAVLSGGVQFGECSTVTVVLLCIFSPCLSCFFYVPLRPSLCGLQVAKGHPGSRVELGGGFLTYRAATSFPRDPGNICFIFSSLGFWSLRVRMISCQVSSGPWSLPVALRVPHHEKEVSQLLWPSLSGA